MMRMRSDTVGYNSASAMFRRFMYTKGEDIADNVKGIRVVTLLQE